MGDNEDNQMIKKRLQSLALLRGDRLYRARNLQNDQIENKGKEGQEWFNKSPRNTLNNDYYIPYCLICD
ncbi:putative dual-specificity RNA methyltransferase RlmN [Dirofilaria immitis]